MWAQAVAFAIYLWNAKRFAELKLFARFDPPHAKPIGELLRTGLPIGITVLMEGGLFIATALLIARLGAVPAAAHQIAINVSALCFMVPMGVAEATTVRVGHALGAGDMRGIRRAAHAGYLIVLCTQAFSAMALLLGHDAVVALYTQDAAVAALAGSLLLFAAAFQFPDGIQVLSVSYTHLDVYKRQVLSLIVSPDPTAAVPAALTAFLRGVERRGAVFAELQSGDLSLIHI